MLEQFVGKDTKTVAVVCNQLGDVGKGKVIDALGEWPDIVARGTAGANAGHTTEYEGLTIILHQIPSGIRYDSLGKKNVIGSGTAFDPPEFNDEVGVLDQNGLSHDNLMISHRARLVLPPHKLMDILREETPGHTMIGTTGRGIGPAYSDFYDRYNRIVVNDLFNPDVFRARLQESLIWKMFILQHCNPDRIQEIMNSKRLENGRFYDPKKILNVGEITDAYLEYGRMVKDMVRDTDAFMRANVGKKRILLEGAQGTLLSVDYGPAPYLTSADPSRHGLARGVGLSVENIDLTLGLAKVFYMTRVGEGPFPTEFGGRKSAEHCRKSDSKKEVETYGHPSMNDPDEFLQGIAIRQEGREFGATTGRLRRTGWDDLGLLRAAMDINGPDLVLTKIDVLTGCEVIRVCNGHIYTGPTYRLGERVLRHGARLKKAPMDAEVLANCEPIYTDFAGWKEDIRGVTRYSDLPGEARRILDFVRDQTGGRIRAISTGPDRRDMILL